MLCPLSFRGEACREAAGRVIMAYTQCPKGPSAPLKYNSGHVQPGPHFYIFFQFWPKMYLAIINLCASFLPVCVAPHIHKGSHRLRFPSVMRNDAQRFKSSQIKILFTVWTNKTNKMFIFLMEKKNIFWSLAGVSHCRSCLTSGPALQQNAPNWSTHSTVQHCLQTLIKFLYLFCQIPALVIFPLVLFHTESEVSELSELASTLLACVVFLGF